MKTLIGLLARLLRWVLGFFDQALGALAVRLFFKGRYHVSCYRADGTLRWREDVPNGVCTGGITDLLGTYFNSGSQITTWYFGLIDNAGGPTLAATDTMASHGTWTELTAYNESVRQTWTKASPATGAITTATVSTFTMNATKTVYGMFLTSVSAKGGSTGILWSTGAFSSTQAVVSTDTVQVGYTLSAA